MPGIAIGGFEDHYFIGDMRNFKLGREVDVLLNWFTSFGYFDDEGNMETLRNFHENLRNGGLLIIDFPNFHLLSIDNRAVVYDYGDIIGIVREYLEDNSRYSVLHERFYRRDGDNLVFIGESRTRVRRYFIEDFMDMLPKAGFAVLGVHSTLSFSDFNRLRDQRFTVVAIKR
ncbi:hypothetical protein [Vulcanisaeta distributa]|uniref:hypothetical protein n=1 Tax=Vulcanisaeta distributa TaxID=164451 RepID=UPI0006D01969|nr:hypothetical protein [Vulcanisaeta distributa]